MRSFRLLNLIVFHMIAALALTACSGTTDVSPVDTSTSNSTVNTVTTLETADISPPTAPGNLRNASGSPATDSIELVWDASTDNVSVTGYRVMKDSLIVATTTGTSYTGSNLQSNTAYQYTIVAFDAADNTATSNGLSVTTLESADISPPTAPGNLRNASGSPTTDSIELVWDASTDNVNVTGYRVMKDSVIVATTTDTSYSGTNLQPGTSYQYSIVAFDAADNSTSSNTITVDTVNVDTSGVITLNWLPPTENTDNTSLTDLTGYKIHYGLSADSLDTTITVNNPGLSSYVVENLNTNATYYFTITSVNSQNVVSVNSDIVSKFISG